MDSVDSTNEKYFKNIVRIPGQLYFDLYEKGGRNADRLIACYALLRSVDDHNNYFSAYKGRNGVTVKKYQMLSKKSGLSRATLEKYVPLMIGLEIARFDKDGNFFLTGTNKLNKNFRNRKSNTLKIVPIFVVKQDIIRTAHSVMMVRICSSEGQQKRQIELKENRKVLMSKFIEMKNGTPDVHLPLKTYKKLRKTYDKYKKKGINLNEDVILSLNSYSKLKGHDNPHSNKGGYWKKKLTSNRWIHSERRFNRLSEFYYPKEMFDFGKQYGIFAQNVFWRDGVVYEEICATLYVTNRFKSLGQNPSKDSVSESPKKNNSSFSCLIKSNDLSRAHTHTHVRTHTHTHTPVRTHTPAQKLFDTVVCNSFSLPETNPFLTN